MKKFFLMVFCCLPLLTGAQPQAVQEAALADTVVSSLPFAVLENARLLSEARIRAYYPVLDAVGNHLLFSDGNTGALLLYDFTRDTVLTVTRAYVAGGDAAFGGDGKVYYVTQQVGADRLVYRTGRCYDPASHQSQAVTGPRHGVMQPVRARQSGVIKEAGFLTQNIAAGDTVVYVEGSTVHVVLDGEDRSFSPVESQAGYLWPSLSPDGTRVLFFAAGKGAVVIDLQGRVLAMLGNYEMPCWWDDSYVVAQHAEDDGHQITSSQLMLLKADGSQAQPLTEPSSMAMQPASAAGRIVYCTIDGQLFEMKIEMNE